MKIQLTTMVLGVCLLAGCGMFKGGSKPEAQLPAGTGTAATAQPPWGGNPQQPPKRGIPPAAAKASRGKVAHVDAALGFVVIDFTFSALPAAGMRFGVFRNGLRIGEITTTKMVDEAFQVADINKGDIRMGDDVRFD